MNLRIAVIIFCIIAHLSVCLVAFYYRDGEWPAVKEKPDEKKNLWIRNRGVSFVVFGVTIGLLSVFNFIDSWLSCSGNLVAGVFQWVCIK